MSQQDERFTVCNFCGGAIPADAARIGGVSGTLYLGGQAVTFSNMDFCSTEHMASWVQSQPPVPTPNPPYPPPPAGGAA